MIFFLNDSYLIARTFCVPILFSCMYLKTYHLTKTSLGITSTTRAFRTPRAFGWVSGHHSPLASNEQQVCVRLGAQTDDNRVRACGGGDVVRRHGDPQVAAHLYKRGVPLTLLPPNPTPPPACPPPRGRWWREWDSGFLPAKRPLKQRAGGVPCPYHFSRIPSTTVSFHWHAASYRSPDRQRTS